VVMKSTPAPPPVSFAAKQHALEANGGRPLDAATMSSLRASAPVRNDRPALRTAETRNETPAAKPSEERRSDPPRNDKRSNKKATKK